MNKILLLLVVSLFVITQTNAQGLEEDNSVLYMKANVLFESGRYDEAIRMYNQVLSNDENHSKALYMRARAKYELSAYKGTKKDILQFIDITGVNKDVIKLMANTELKLSNLNAAENYVTTAIEMDPFDDAMLLLSGDIHMALENRNDACEAYSKSAQLGNGRARQKMGQYCAGYIPSKTQEVLSDNGNDRNTEDTETTEEEKSDGGIVTLEDIVRDAQTNSDNTDSGGGSSPDMNAEKTIEVDSKLSISLTEGIGDRNVSSQPSIFMLSDQDGQVVIDLCIGADGKVTDASFNRGASTIFRSSLTSLALRKAKEFIFESSSYGEQCGKMIYNIKS